MYQCFHSCTHLSIHLSAIYPLLNPTISPYILYISIYLYIYPDIHVTLSLGIYVWYARTLCNLWEAIDLLGKRIVSTTTAGYIQITSGGLIGTIGSAIRIHLIQPRIGQSSRYGITGYTMRSQVRSFLSHLSTGRNTRSVYDIFIRWKYAEIRPVKGGAIYKHTKLPFNYKNVCLERDY